MSDTTTNPIDCHTGKDYLQQILVLGVERDSENQTIQCFEGNIPKILNMLGRALDPVIPLWVMYQRK